MSDLGLFRFWIWDFGFGIVPILDLGFRIWDCSDWGCRIWDLGLKAHSAESREQSVEKWTVCPIIAPCAMRFALCPAKPERRSGELLQQKSLQPHESDERTEDFFIDDFS
jgi:hypothetical protein